MVLSILIFIFRRLTVDVQKNLLYSFTKSQPQHLQKNKLSRTLKKQRI